MGKFTFSTQNALENWEVQVVSSNHVVVTLRDAPSLGSRFPVELLRARLTKQSLGFLGNFFQRFNKWEVHPLIYT